MNFKKLTAAVLSMCMLMQSAAVLAEDADAQPTQNENGVYVITNADELEWFSENIKTVGSKDVVLASDIDLKQREWTPIGSSTCKYSGSFDGNGYTVSGLNVTGFTYGGLFGYVSGSVSNVKVSGSVSYSGTSTAYLGGIAGQNNGTISNCTSDTSVSGKGTLGGIAGQNNGTVSCCENKGNVTGTSGDCGGICGVLNGGKVLNSFNKGAVSTEEYYYAGGIAGKMQSGSLVENVFSRGDVKAKYAGGIVGQIYDKSSAVSGAYATGTISGTSYVGGITAALGYSVSATVLTNCFFLKDSNINSSIYAVKTSSNDRDDLCGKTEEELKAESMPSLLGGAFEADVSEINDGYPILKWQNPNAVYKAVFTVEPEEADVVLTDDNGKTYTGEKNGNIFTFNELKGGKYTYTVSYEDGDCSPENGSFSVGTEDVYKKITLSQRVYKAELKLSPSNAEFVLKKGDEELDVTDTENGVYLYSLPNGEYTYFASLFGYADKTGTVAINKADISEEISLVTLPRVKTEIILTDKDTGSVLDEFKSKIYSGEYEVSAEEDGSYMLPVGKYSYEVKQRGYAKCKGEFEVTSEDEKSGSKQITLKTYPSSVWDGDADEPACEDGKWQISDGNELAWFSAYVGKKVKTNVENATYDAVLTADIELGGEINWTPIGTSSYAYSGCFDGNGYSVKGLRINANAAYQGLFGKTAQTAVIKNLTAEGNVTNTYTSSYAYTGGICGYNSGVIKGCENKVNVTGDGGYTGGICGCSYGSYSARATVSQCSNYGTISYATGTGQEKGGICGKAQYTNIGECSNYGDIDGNGNFVGGICGELYYSDMADCFNVGAVSSNGYNFGGIAGKTTSSSVSSCYSAGTVSTAQGTARNNGAFIGYVSGGTIENAYCLIEADGINSGLSAVGNQTSSSVSVKADADEMRDIFIKLNTSTLWMQNAALNNGYPVLTNHNRTIKIDGTIADNNSAVTAGKHTFNIDYRTVGTKDEDAMLAVAVYNQKALKYVSVEKAPYIAQTEYILEEGDALKIMFWKNDLTPVTDVFTINAR